VWSGGAGNVPTHGWADVDGDRHGRDDRACVTAGVANTLAGDCVDSACSSAAGGVRGTAFQGIVMRQAASGAKAGGSAKDSTLAEADYKCKSSAHSPAFAHIRANATAAAATAATGHAASCDDGEADATAAEATATAAGAADYDYTKDDAIFEGTTAAVGKDAAAETHHKDDSDDAVVSSAVDAAATVIAGDAVGSRAVENGVEANARRPVEGCCVGDTSSVVHSGGCHAAATCRCGVCSSIGGDAVNVGRGAAARHAKSTSAGYASSSSEIASTTVAWHKGLWQGGGRAGHDGGDEAAKAGPWAMGAVFRRS